MLAPEYLGPTQTGHQTISTANTNRNGTGTIADLATMTTAANGGRGGEVLRIRAAATGTTTAGSLTFYRKVTGGTYYALFTVVVGAVTVGAGTRPWSLDAATSPAFSVGNDGSIQAQISLAAGEALGVSTYNAEEFDVSVDFGEYHK